MEIDISLEKKQYFEKLLELMNVFGKYCDKHGLDYYVDSGTLLGAIRHKGFIPWDDDVDLAMPRSDYDRMKEIMAKDPLPEPFFFQTPATDMGYPKGFARIRNSNTTAIPYDDVAMKCNRGIFVDIFPIDNVPDNAELFCKQIKRLKMTRLFMNCYARYHSGFGAESTTRTKKIAYYMMIPLFKLRIITMRGLYARFEKIASAYKNVNTKKCGTFTCTYENPRFIFNTEDYNNKTYAEFEGLKVPIPEGYDSVLRNAYGDYMIPVKAPTEHGDMVFSTTIPYDKYIEEHFDELKCNWLKQTEGYKGE